MTWKKKKIAAASHWAHVRQQTRPVPRYVNTQNDGIYAIFKHDILLTFTFCLTYVEYLPTYLRRYNNCGLRVARSLNGQRSPKRIIYFTGKVENPVIIYNAPVDVIMPDS